MRQGVDRSWASEGKALPSAGTAFGKALTEQSILRKEKCKGAWHVGVKPQEATWEMRPKM